MGKVLPVGTRSNTVNGYVKLKVAPGRTKYEHIVIAEKALGHLLPDGVRVHHVDDDGTNNKTSNLCILQSEREHQQLHARRLLKRRGGNPFTDSWCPSCQSVKPLTAFTTYRRPTGCCSSACLKCERSRVRNYNLRMKHEGMVKA